MKRGDLVICWEEYYMIVDFPTNLSAWILKLETDEQKCVPIHLLEVL